MLLVLDRKAQIGLIVTSAVFLTGFIQAVGKMLLAQNISAFSLVSTVFFLVGTCAVILFNASWRWIWKRLPVLGRLLFPDLNGTWVGTLQTNWKNPVTGEVPGPIEVTVLIRQDLLNFSVAQQTRESVSWSTRVFPRADSDIDRYTVWFSYDNKPQANVSAVSSIHEGVCCLEINPSLNRDQLNGQYYTSRSTSGNITLRRFSEELTTVPGREDWPSGQLVNDFRRSGI